jgi:hypothetical protein
MGSLQCSLARDDFEAGTVCPACAHLRAALELLQQGGEPPLRPDLQAEVRGKLTKLLAVIASWDRAATSSVEPTRIFVQITDHDGC